MITKIFSVRGTKGAITYTIHSFGQPGTIFGGLQIHRLEPSRRSDSGKAHRCEFLDGARCFCTARPLSKEERYSLFNNLALAKEKLEKEYKRNFGKEDGLVFKEQTMV